MRGQSAIVAAVVAALLPVGASVACAPADPSLAGHYYLHGVMEVGSELLLKADGRFEYMLAYGALDELASGCWTRNGATVTLHASKFTTSMEDPRKFKRLDLTVDPAASSSDGSTPTMSAPIRANRGLSYWATKPPAFVAPPALSGRRSPWCFARSSRDCKDCKWDRSRRGSPVRTD